VNVQLTGLKVLVFNFDDKTFRRSNHAQRVRIAHQAGHSGAAAIADGGQLITTASGRPLGMIFANPTAPAANLAVGRHHTRFFFLVDFLADFLAVFSLRTPLNFFSSAF
jgi:hypothetical protein